MLIGLEKTLGLPRSFPVKPSTCKLFQLLRVPPMFGVPVPKLPPKNSVSTFCETPGRMRNIDTTSRPRIEICSNCFALISAEFSELDVCTDTPCAATVIDSLTLPTCSVRLPTGNRSAALNILPVLRNGRKPGCSTLIVYAPGCSAGNRKSPASFVVADRSSPVRSLCSFTAAFGIEFPLESSTVPTIEPEIVCACKLVSVAAASNNKLFIRNPSHHQIWLYSTTRYNLLRMTYRVLIPLVYAATLAAQHSDTALKNPFQSPDDRARGGAFYRSQCASCHGIDAKGGASGPNLATANFRHASNDEGLFRVITKGVAGTAMPGFSMNGREIWQIVSFIRGLSASRASNVTGDAAAGRQLFQSNGCINCHWLNGAGAPRGLDLSAIATRLTPAEMLSALTDPSAEVAPEYWIWQATTKDGKTLRGHRYNEDTFSLQILDTAGRLRSLNKADLREQTLDRRSLMPSFRDKLNEQQLNNLVSYLATLQGAAK